MFPVSRSSFWTHGFGGGGIGGFGGKAIPAFWTTGFFGGDIGGFGGTGGFIGKSFWTRRRWWRKCSRHTGQIRLPVTSIPMYRKQKTWPQVLRTALGRRRGQTEQFPSAVTTKMGGLEKRRASALPFLFSFFASRQKFWNILTLVTFPKRPKDYISSICYYSLRENVLHWLRNLNWSYIYIDR